MLNKGPLSAQRTINTPRHCKAHLVRPASQQRSRHPRRYYRKARSSDVDQVVTEPMAASAVKDMMRWIKKALIQRVQQAELSHHLGYAEGKAKPEVSVDQRNGTSGMKVSTEAA